MAIDTINGRVQVSGPTAEETVGLLVERGESFCGVLLSRTEAQELAHHMLDGLGLNQAVDK